MDVENQKKGASGGEPEVRCTVLVGAEAREKELWNAFLRIEKEVGEKMDVLREELREASEAWGKAYAEVNQLRRMSAPTTEVCHGANNQKGNDNE